MLGVLVVQACAGDGFQTSNTGSGGSTGNGATASGSGGSTGGGSATTSAGGGSGGQPDGPCAGPFECQGATLVRCVEAERTAVSECGTAALCDAEAGACLAPPCATGERRCVESTLVECNEEQSGFAELAICVTPQLCDASAGMCRAPACNVGDYRCTGASLEACTLGRTGFEAVLDCDSASDCDANTGECRASCTPDAYQCNGATLLRCNADGTALAVQQLCFSETLCDEAAGECQEPECEANEYSCDGATLQICRDDRTGFENEETCATPALCSAATGSCAEPFCDDDQVRCQDNVLERCNDARTGFEVAQTCETTQACEASPPGCSDLRELAAELHGFTTLVPCSMPYAARDCRTASQQACADLANADPVLNGARPTDETLRFGGEPGTIYNVRVRVQGQVEGKQYAGGTDQSSAAGLPADGFYVGGAPDNSIEPPFNTYAMRVSSPSKDYFFNSIATGNDTRIRSSTFDIDYEAVIRVEGGATLRMIASDPNCLSTKNCADPVAADCNPHSFGGLSPEIADAIGSQPYDAQFVGFVVQSVTIEP